MEDKKANLFIVGAMKAGTTSFLELLSHHEEIHVSPVKEPHYFINELPEDLYKPSKFFNLDEYLDKEFPEPLHITKIEKEKQYKQIFSLATNETYLAEGSTAYLHAEETANLIYDYNPDAKIIILIRDPLKRAFSHYKMNLALGKEHKSFEHVILSDIDDFLKGELSWTSYLGMSFYDKAVLRFQNQFKNVLIIQFEDFIENEQLELDKVASYLNIGAFQKIENENNNTSKTLRFQLLFYYLKRLGLKDYFSNFFSSTFKQWLFRVFTKKETKKIVLSSSTLDDLQKIFNQESRICYY